MKRGWSFAGVFIFIFFAQSAPAQELSISPQTSSESLAKENEGSRPTVAPLYLTCMGGGSASATETATAHAFSSDGSTASALGSRRTSRGFDGQIDVRLFAGDDRIRLPRVMLPPIHGGDNGWLKVQNLVTSEREINGRAGINLLNNPKFRIDRVSATIEISGSSGDFAGVCRKIDPDLDKPKF